jgi:hypothetical protein
MMVYAAQPWGNNYAYQNFIGYVMLVIFVGWAVSPYLFILLAIRREMRDNKGLRISLLIVISLFCMASMAIIFDTVFVHIDAQGGLVFLFLPIYQWVAIGLLVFIYFLAKVLISR